MAKIQNNFTKGVINKDLDERLVPSDMLIDAENFVVTTSDNSGAGVGKNVPGNIKKTNYNILGGKTIGKGINASQEKVYNLVKGTNHDYLIEYNVETNTSEVVLQATTGGVLNFQSGERITNVDIISSGEEGGDLIAWSGDSNPPRIINIERAKTWAIDGFTEDEISVMKPAPIFAPILLPTSTGDNTAIFLTERFVSFGYRWRYKDGYYSAISSWSEYSFSPGDFDVDFDSFENLGMVNRFNAVRILYNTGQRDVDAIELVFKESNSENVYVIDRFIKSEEGFGDNETRNFIFSTNKIFTILNSDQFFRNFDNVPLSAVAQTIIGNRLAYANYIEQRDLIDSEGNPIKIDFNVNFVSDPIGSQPISNFYSESTYTTENGISTIQECVFNINLENLLLKQGAIISIDFFVESYGVVGRDPLTTKFESNFSYVLEADYTDVLDFFTNSSFKTEVETTLSSLFNTEALILPDDGTVHEYQGFLVTNPSTNIISIKLPAYTFEIDNGVDPISYVDEFYKNEATKATFLVNGSNTSMHSNREYEACLIYADNKGRKTTALVSKTNSVYIPISNSDTKNRLLIEILNNPPAWATHYKFGIKQINKLYETIYTSVFYEDGVYRWFKLEGSNKQKVKEGDVLICKADRSGVKQNVIKVKVLEVTLQEKDFLPDNKDVTGNDIIEQQGLYMKIKPVGLDINYEVDEFIESPFADGAVFNGRPTIYIDLFSTEDPANPGTYFPYDLSPGDQVTLRFDSYRSGRSDGFYENTFNVNGLYANFDEWFTAELGSTQFIANTGEEYFPEIVQGTATRLAIGDTVTYNFVPSTNGRYYLKVEGVHPGNGGSRRGFVNGKVSVRNVDGIIIFEKELEDVINTSYFETPETYTITDGQHQFTNHLLSRTFNCFCFGNGAESYQIKDNFNAKFLNIDFKPTAVSNDVYKQVNRFADITYSGIFNSNSGINRLNEFNLSLANYKDDIEKVYGPIMKIKGQDTNLEVFQEDKCSVVFYGKDLLYNADGTSNLSRIEDVLGQQKTYVGEYGISFHPDSFDDYASNSYFTDVKRGVVMRKNDSNGLQEISFYGMRDYFKKLFRDNVVNHINGKYDQFYDYYILNIQYNNTEYVTWIYSDKDNGWMSRLTFNPEDMIRINNHFISFKNGEIYLHNQNNIFNTFYGVESPSKFSFNFSQDPSSRKNFRAISQEGTDAWGVTLNTDLDSGYINKADFEKKEGVFYAYIRNSNENIDSSLLSCQGIGIGTVSGLTLTFSFDLESVISIGDQIRNANLELVGTIVSKTNNSLTLNTMNNIGATDFVLCSKPQSIENQSMLGYYMKTTLELTKNTYAEIFAVNCEVAKSYE